ncbi:heavy-metal-associated domain-containing protein [Orrella sp. JC864]|uniref:heavy-metal-associated domain-containing protein n=1 Tax=Orrella sp. JC864 TaxID=3120298 RepID=UPI0012BD7407
MNIRYHVPDMSCGHCVNAITQAVQAAVPGSQVDVDLPTHTVTVLGATEGDRVLAAIQDAGYSPTEIAG